jgi:thymidylate synthase (FAD)
VTEVVLRSDCVVRLVDAMGDDLAILEDARTSIRRPGKATLGGDSRELTDGQRARLVDFFRLRHASVLRGCVLKVEVEVPIFVQRQLRTHWVGMAQGWSENDWLGFNDQSGRYSRQLPQFWVPGEVRLEGEGFDPMAPAFRRGSDAFAASIRDDVAGSHQAAFATYRRLIDAGVAREQARSVLPEGLYVAGRITGNLNAWFGLMSLRIDHPGNTVQTHPQAEIQDVAAQVETLVAARWPEAHAAWAAAGRGRP